MAVYPEGMQDCQECNGEGGCYSHPAMPTHICLNGEESFEYAWWARDAQGIELCKVCDRCEDEKLSHYRPEILMGYDQSDVDEPIEPEE